MTSLLARTSFRWSTAAVVAFAAISSLAACTQGPAKPAHRERSLIHDAECREAALPQAFMYPAKNRTEYGPDDPKADGCTLLVPDHLFCCPKASRPTDR